MTNSVPSLVHEVFEQNRRFLWGLSYRMTGCAADADDVVQETFVRAIERPPLDRDRPWRPWLVKVAVNVGRDVLRRRRRRAYIGPWLPSPIETAGEAPSADGVPAAAESAEARYSVVESVSMAFLLAVEALTPAQRAVLLLRDVFDYSAREVALALDLSEANVRTTHHRARRAMAAYERTRESPTAIRHDRTRRILQQFLEHLSAHDVAGIERLLACDVRVITDGGGEVVAALRPVIGRSRALRFLLKVSDVARARARTAFRTINGGPAAIIELPVIGPRHPRRLVWQVELGSSACISTIYITAARRKLAAIAPVA